MMKREVGDRTCPIHGLDLADKALFWASGIVQSVSLVMLIRSLRGGSNKEARSLKKVPIVSLVPTGRRGFVLSCQTRF